MMKTESKIYREQGVGRKECVRAPKFLCIFACTQTLNSVFILDQAENLKQTAETDAVVIS